MNYRHIYHAGNFADVFKHWGLTLVLDKLCEKDAPFCLIDSHAGLGLYDLNSENAQKTLEYVNGVEEFIKQKPALDFINYLDIVNKYMQDSIYPGSAAIMQHYLRDNDRLYLAELHQDDYTILNDIFYLDKRVKTFNQDAYKTIKSLLPPSERRGLVFIDPPFEKADEFTQIINCIQESLKRFANGIYVIWYPIKDRYQVDNFYRQLIKLNIPKTFIVELNAHKNVSFQLMSCGMLFINPPWQIYEKFEANLTKFMEYLNFTNGTYNLEWLVEEK